MGDVKAFDLWIGGQWTPAASGETFDVENPATGEVACRVAKAESADVDRAVSAARDAFEGWRSTPPIERARIFDSIAAAVMAAAGELAPMETLTSGGTLRRTTAVDVPGLAYQFMHQAELTRTYEFVEPLPHPQLPAPGYDYVIKEPYGVVASIAPFNFPLFFASAKTLPALAAGCTVVLKPSPYTPATALMLAEIATGAGLPPGVLNVVAGPGAAAGEAVVSHPQVDKITFTGSTATGKRIMQLAASSLKELTLECGGKAPNIVLEDADLDLAVDGAVFAMFGHAGQVCVAGSRLLLQDSIHDEFLDRLVERTAKLKLGDPMDMSTDLGPLISRDQFEMVMSYIQLGQKEGAKLVLGGGRPAGLDRGYFVEPTIFANVDNSMRIAQEEIFGPVLSVIRFSSPEDAARIGNDTPYGLAAGVWSRNVPKAMEIAAQLRHGTVWVNDWLFVHGDAPYGGFKQSGVGYEGGHWGMDEFVLPKHVHVSLTPSREEKYWWGSVLS